MCKFRLSCIYTFLLELHCKEKIDESVNLTLKLRAFIKLKYQYNTLYNRLIECLTRAGDIAVAFRPRALLSFQHHLNSISLRKHT